MQHHDLSKMDRFVESAFKIKSTLTKIMKIKNIVNKSMC